MKELGKKRYFQKHCHTGMENEHIEVKNLIGKGSRFPFYALIITYISFGRKQKTAKKKRSMEYIGFTYQLNCSINNHCEIESGHMIIHVITAPTYSQNSAPSCDCKPRTICIL